MKKWVMLIIVILLFSPIELMAATQYISKGNGYHEVRENNRGKITTYSESCSGNPCYLCGGSNGGSSSSGSSKPKHYHNNNSSCGYSHCWETWCDCGYGSDHNCGGGCSFSVWSLIGSQHVMYCTRGCGAQNGRHDPAWGNWTTGHTITCGVCGLSGSHSATWSAYTDISSGVHGQKCTNTSVTQGGTTTSSGKTCPAVNNRHSANFGSYYKVGNAGESNGTASHRSDCQYSGCSRYQSHSPSWGGWDSINDNQHRRSCTGGSCGLTQTLKHDFNYTPIEGNIHYHTVTCEDCAYEIGAGNPLAKHVDRNPADGFCDMEGCRYELVEIEYSPDRTELTNSNVTVTITIFKDGAEDDEVHKSHVYTENNINDLEEERYEFDFNDEGINWKDRPIVDNINKTVSGRIEYTPNQPTSEEVEIKFLPDYEEDTYGDYSEPQYGGRSKQIYARVLVNGQPETEWKQAEDADRNPTITYVFTQNGVCEIEIKDTVGNGDPSAGKESVRIPVVVDWIISGQATAATTSDILANGTIFTDILINTDKEWEITNAQNQIAVKIYRVTETGMVEETAKENKVKISKMEIKDFNENRISETPIGRGLYYIKTSIGGPGVFTLEEGDEKTQYVVELNWVNASGTKISGGNRIEVTVNKLNNLT